MRRSTASRARARVSRSVFHRRSCAGPIASLGPIAPIAPRRSQPVPVAVSGPNARRPGRVGHGPVPSGPSGAPHAALRRSRSSHCHPYDLLGPDRGSCARRCAGRDPVIATALRRSARRASVHLSLVSLDASEYRCRIMDERPIAATETTSGSAGSRTSLALRPETRHWLLSLARAAVGSAAEAYRDGRLDELEERLAGYGPAGGQPREEAGGAAGAGASGAGASGAGASSEVARDLVRPAAAFVTLTVGGELRGCMGRLDAGRPLWENVRDAAIAAAIGDPRFPPLAPEEVPRVRIEVSILSLLTEIADAADFDAERHGIVVEAAGRRALLLPKVAREQGWDEAATLAAVCRKAGLPPEAWRWPEARLWVFEAEDFGEAEWSAGPGTAGAGTRSAGIHSDSGDER